MIHAHVAARAYGESQAQDANAPRPKCSLKQLAPKEKFMTQSPVCACEKAIPPKVSKQRGDNASKG